MRWIGLVFDREGVGFCLLGFGVGSGRESLGGGSRKCGWRNWGRVNVEADGLDREVHWYV